MFIFEHCAFRDKWYKQKSQNYHPIKPVFTSCSLIWHSLVDTLPLILPNLYRQVGKGSQVYIGIDPIVGLDNYTLLNWLIKHLHNNNVYDLSHIYMLEEKGRPNLKSTIDLNLSECLEREWSSYTTSLVVPGIFLDRETNRIVWNCNKQNGFVTAYQMYCL